MTSIKTFAEAEAALTALVPLSKEITGKDITLDRMRPLMDALGNPQRNLRIIHVAGTSGKTSTSYYIAALLRAAGQKVGLTVSPHLDSVTERIQINLKPLPEAEFVSALNELFGIIEKTHQRPTYFEVLIALAYWYFEREGVDYAVIETGMGGTQDGTNIADNPDKLCVITDIGLDHMHVLGHTVREIARQKAGIIHVHNNVCMYRQTDEINEVFETHCSQHQAILHQFDELTLTAGAPEYLKILPVFQQRNWTLAHEAYKQLQTRDDLPELDENRLIDTMRILIPGRMDVTELEGKTVIMDGAHNEQKTEAFVESFKHSYPGQKASVLLSLKQGKEFTAVLPLLKPIISSLILTEYSTGQDVPAAPIDAHELGKVAERFGFQHVTVELDIVKAYQSLLNTPDQLAVITGSFYLLGQLRKLRKELR